VEIEFDKIEKKTYFDIKVKGWFTFHGGEKKWVMFRRIENEDGTYNWTEWSTGGVPPKKDQEVVVESWYQNFIRK
jgi:hypothetical protein